MGYWRPISFSEDELSKSQRARESARYDTADSGPYTISGRGKNRLPRLVPRNVAFGQSKNTVKVFHNYHGRKILKILLHDWFHAFLRLSTLLSIMILLTVWTALIVVFALAYVAIDHGNETFCGLGNGSDPIRFGPAFAFSLETCTTVGYGLPNGSNAYFNECEALQFVIYLQMVWSMLFNGFLFAFMFARLGRSELRGAQVLASSKAVVSLSNSGQVRFQMRLFDVDAQNPVVEAHVRLYALMKDRPVPRPIRILQPNDELGSVLFLSLPYVVVHHIDVYSMLHPYTPDSDLSSGLILRQVDSVTASREEIFCPICGDSYGTHERWVRHARYQQLVERKEKYPVEGTHQSLKERDFLPRALPHTSLAELKQYFHDEVAEVISVVEGIDPLTSGTFQSLQSYKFEDIEWNEDAQFAPCLQVQSGKIMVDLDRFHDIITVTKDDKRANEICEQGQPSLRTHDSLLVEGP